MLQASSNGIEGAHPQSPSCCEWSSSSAEVMKRFRRLEERLVCAVQAVALAVRDPARQLDWRLVERPLPGECVTLESEGRRTVPDPELTSAVPD